MHKFRTQLLATTGMLALSGVAYAAELPVKAPPVAPVAPVINWTGFYVGAQIGGASFDPSCHTTHSSGVFSTAFPCDGEGTTSSISSAGVIGGGKIGYDWQWNKVVLGAVGEFDWTDLNGTSRLQQFGSPTVGTASEDVHWLASARGRVGWAFDNVLFYATGGVAWTQIKAHASLIDPLDPAISFASQSSSDRTGAVAGGGFEYRFTPNLSFVGELLWYGFGTTSTTGVTPGGVAFTTQFNNQDILAGTLGVNWRF